MATSERDVLDGRVLAELRRLVGTSGCATTAAWVAGGLDASISSVAASLKRLVGAGLVERDRKHRGTYYRPAVVQEEGNDRER